jgi:hypothetical protein
MEGYGPDLTLPSGRNANVRLSEPTGRDLLTAARMVKPNEPPQAFSMAMIAVLTRIDGNAVAYEDVQALSLSDILALMSATGLDSPVPTSAPTPSSLSSGAASPSRS